MKCSFLGKIQIDGLNVVYDASGIGPDVVFIHGWAGSRLHWKEAGKYLPNMRVRALDLWGFGDSDEPEKKLEIEDYVSLANVFMQKQNIEESILVGHSIGGGIAANYANCYPQVVSKLALIEAPVGIELKKLKIPILLVLGDPESITFSSKRSEIAVKQAECNSRSQIRYVKNAKHNPMLENPEEFYRILKSFVEMP